mmetsp:Transcript_28984/g.79513  ORF Transcript_28984/g.79513 Transcript_28984/m.79513 type:complete len:382 (-) Transcript_28984:1122-2267(-)
MLLLCLLLLLLTFIRCGALASIPVLFDSSNSQHRDLIYHPEQPARITETIRLLARTNDSTSVELVDVAESSQDILGETGGLDVTVKKELFTSEQLDYAKSILLRTHKQSLVHKLRESCNNAQAKRIQDGKSSLGHMGYLDSGGGTYITTATFDICLRATASWIKALDWSSQHGGKPAIALTRPPGHHATIDLSNGFCVFNHAAAAAIHAMLQDKKKVSILDWDVHYGQGVADIIQHFPNARYASIHQTGAFPYMGETLKVSGEHDNVLTIPIAPETSWTCGYKDGFMKALDFISKTGEWAPDVVIVCAGYDALDSDELASCSLQAADYGSMTTMLQEHLDAKSGNNPPSLMFGLEGGYQLSPMAGGGNLPEAVVETIHALL